MLHKFKQSQVVLSRTDKLLAKFLILRKRLWMKLILLSELTSPQNSTPLTAETMNTLKSFCDLLMDYSAQAHLSIYSEIETALRHRHPQLPPLNRTLVDTLESTLDAILAFDYQFPLSHAAQAPHHSDVNKKVLRQSLSELGDQLAARYQLENRIFSRYKKLMKEPPSSPTTHVEPQSSKPSRRPGRRPGPSAGA